MVVWLYLMGYKFEPTKLSWFNLFEFVQIWTVQFEWLFNPIEKVKHFCKFYILVQRLKHWKVLQTVAIVIELNAYHKPYHKPYWARNLLNMLAHVRLLSSSHCCLCHAEGRLGYEPSGRICVQVYVHRTPVDGDRYGSCRSQQRTSRHISGWHFFTSVSL